MIAFWLCGRGVKLDRLFRSRRFQRETRAVVLSSVQIERTMCHGEASACGCLVRPLHRDMRAVVCRVFKSSARSVTARQALMATSEAVLFA